MIKVSDVSGCIVVSGLFRLFLAPGVVYKVGGWEDVTAY
jgi:hypothetical protein